jgi:hypothetical protein
MNFLEKQDRAYVQVMIKGPLSVRNVFKKSAQDDMFPFSKFYLVQDESYGCKLVSCRQKRCKIIHEFSTSQPLEDMVFEHFKVEEDDMTLILKWQTLELIKN